jgi:type I restriction enzyme S subunit
MMPSMTTLGEILNVQNGFAFKSELFSDGEEGMPLIRIRDLKKSCTEVRYVGEYKEEYVVNAGDYLIGMDGDFEIHQWHGDSSLLNQRVCRLARFSDEVEPDYVYYAIQEKLREIHARTAFVTVKHLSSKQIKAIEIPFPTLAEQRRIADILKRADSIRRLSKQAQDVARQLAPSLFIEMFGDPVANPNGWIIKPLKEVADIGSGVTKGRRLDGHQTVDLPYLAVSNVQDGHLNLAKVKSIQVKLAEMEKYQVLPGDFLMTEGGDPDKLGRGAIWNGEIDVCLHQNHVFKVRCNRDVLLPEYLRSLVGSHYGKGYFLRVAKQTTGIASINKTQLGKFPVLVPPKELQNEFLSRIEGVNSIMSQQEAAQYSAESSFQSLLHRGFSDNI